MESAEEIENIIENQLDPNDFKRINNQIYIVKRENSAK